MFTKPQNQTLTHNPFRGIGSAPVSQGGNYILPGKHLLEVEECKIIHSTQKNAEMFIAECIVHESTNPEMIPGSKRSWCVNFQHASALGNVKGFAVAALNCTEADIDEETAAALVHESQPIRGVLLNCEANKVKTKKNTDFTKCLWSFVREAA